MLDGEEVFGLEGSVFRQVSAVDGVPHSVNAEASSKGLGAQALGNFRVHRAAKFPEGLHCVLLTNLHYNARAVCHVLAHRSELGKYTLVDFEELLARGHVETEHLHGGNFESFLEDGVNYLTGLACYDCVWLYYAYCAVGEVGTGAACKE